MQSSCKELIYRTGEGIVMNNRADIIGKGEGLREYRGFCKEWGFIEFRGLRVKGRVSVEK